MCFITTVVMGKYVMPNLSSLLSVTRDITQWFQLCHTVRKAGPLLQLGPMGKKSKTPWKNKASLQTHMTTSMTNCGFIFQPGNKLISCFRKSVVKMVLLAVYLELWRIRKRRWILSDFSGLALLSHLRSTT